MAGMSQDEAKLAVARRAVELVEPGMRVGLGTGTTATMFIRELAEKRLRIRCVASSDASFRLGQELGMEMTTLEKMPELDLYVDGADEIAPGLALIKGGGGALLREKIVASAAERFVVVVDASKEVGLLGKFPVPVEVVKMALPLVSARLEKLGLVPRLRSAEAMKIAGGGPYLTDEGNYILDCHGGELQDPARTAAEIRAIVGVVEHGLFLGMAKLALVAGEHGVRERRE